MANIWMNSAMSALVSNHFYDIAHKNTVVPEYLTSLLASGFRAEQECILFRDYQYFGPGDLEDNYRKTEYEEFLNCVSMSRSQISFQELYSLLSVAVKFGHLLHNKLEQTFNDRFRVEILIDSALATRDIVESVYCDFKFYKIRLDIDSKFKSEHLSMIKDEAIMFLE